MELTVFGATGQTGQALVAAALAHGWRVSAFVRSQAGASLALPAGLHVVHGDPGRPADVAAAVRGSDAVCCVFGPRPPTNEVFRAAFTQNIINVMREQDVHRIVCVTGAMVGAMPLNTSVALRALAAAFRWRVPEVAADGAEQEAIVMSSGLDWTLVKPPRLTVRPRTSTVHADAALPVGALSSLGRQDLAEFIFRAAAHDRFVGQRVYVRG
jgi:uncharacterized protein YbjT (DUF2867 family)